MKLSQNARNAFALGALCSISYFAVYIARNILSAVTPQMVESGYTEAYIGSVSSLYFLFYAFGQLINGAIGDRIKAKWMICLGLFCAGITNIVFPFLIMHKYAAMIAYSMTGFFLSMIYGPMTKVVSENTLPLHATRCSIGYTFASLFGSPAAGLFASFLAWESVFATSSAALFIMAVAGFVCFSILEHKGIVKYNEFKPEKRGTNNVKVLLKNHIIKFSFVSILSGIARTSVVFWLPTYIAQHLGFSAKASAGIFTVSTFVISFTAIISIYIYEKLGYNVDLSLIIMFGASALCFILTYFINHPIFNIIFMILAIMSADGAASMLWSVYCPGLKKTGIVSSATGFLDFLSYMAAAAANVIFANAVNTIGWSNLILVWFALMFLGIIVSIPFDELKKKQS